ncbi:hypothetical protein AB0I98_31510 [Streptomyces sp. NPDC050211]|uniref:hypothetical protein n=1 Tax=Streptomyces sp. NPDC050211 TaxID=3154932 RepID=UPI00341F98E5
MRLRSMMAATALAGAAAFGAVAPAEAAPSTASGNVGVQSVVHTIFYEHQNYAGSTLTSAGDYGCDANSDVDWQRSSLSSAWDNEISSWRSFSNCSTRIYEYPNFGEASFGAFVSASYVGDAMNDETSSYKQY